jgi:hypothetical protein
VVWLIQGEEGVAEEEEDAEDPSEGLISRPGLAAGRK